MRTRTNSMPSAAALVAIILVASACAPLGEARGPQRPEPSEPATGPVVASVEVSGTTFDMYDEGAGCLAVEIAQPGLQPTVSRACFDKWNVLRDTSACGWFTEPADDGSGGCDVELPRVIYGLVTDPNVGYVCVGEFSDTGGSAGVAGARILPRDDKGYILTIAEPRERPPAHFLNARGRQMGDPPLDAPSGPIYRFCEGQAALEQAADVYNVELLVTLDASLRSDDVTVFFHSGLDRIGLNGGASSGGEAVPLSIRVTPAVPNLGVEVETEVGPTMGMDLSWPRDLSKILASGEPCSGITTVKINIGAGAIEGDEQPVDLSFVATDCPLEDD